MRQIINFAIFILVGYSGLAAGYMPEAKSATIATHPSDELIESFGTGHMNFETASFTQKPDKTRSEEEQKKIEKKQNRKLGIFSILTAGAGILSIFIFPLMPFLLLTAGAVLGLIAMKRSRKWRKDTDNGYGLGLIGFILSVALIGLAIVLIVNG